MVNCSTAANYYHVLRRQVLRNFRKPLICMTGKFTLRLKEATSEIAEMSEGTRFRRVIEEGHGAAAEEDLVAPDQMRRLVLCSGKVYYDLQRARKLNNITDVALVRVEQLCPFPFGASHSRPHSSRASVSEKHCTFADHVKEAIDTYPQAELVWCQEEPKNQGAWQYVRPRIETASKGLEAQDTPRKPMYTGRPSAASTATGFKCAPLCPAIGNGADVDAHVAGTHTLPSCTPSFATLWLAKKWRWRSWTAASRFGSSDVTCIN